MHEAIMDNIRELKGRADDIFTELRQIIELIEADVSRSENNVSFQQVKEIENTIDRFKKLNLPVPDDLKKLKIDLHVRFEKNNELSEFKIYLQNELKKMLIVFSSHFDAHGKKRAYSADLKSEPRKIKREFSKNSNKNYYLITWNPKHSPWEDMVQFVQKCKSGSCDILRWSCGNNKRILAGDKIFLMRLGVEPRGLLAYGTVVEGSYMDQHWDQSKSNAGLKANFVKISIEKITYPGKEWFIPIGKLETDFPEQLWAPQTSGISIRSDIADSIMHCIFPQSQKG
jgi:hypothetical protein